jgi:hypothetical protein
VFVDQSAEDGYAAYSALLGEVDDLGRRARWCQAGSARGVTIRSARSLRGSTRVRIASTARPDQVGFGAPTWRRNSATSYRNTKIYASFAASDRANSTSHTNTREAKR